ncbi:DUF2236 domain-containing protein [Svornostia abyssi]|uniref:DUF2236 domain-containing protein n=1 Tax=Svornostia abyssi TaxID=2898438 RepID=A0ABY5PJ84_9ACTN|nr:DUF2236 domain-containing protein [Parviterribacteraceae bacterium J379]
MEGSVKVEAAPEAQALAAKLGPDTLFGQTVADRRTWLLMLRTAAILSGHPKSMAVLVNDIDLLADPVERVRELQRWLEELMISDPVAAGTATHAMRERMAQRWGRWHGWDDEALTFAALSLGDGVIFAARTLQGGSLFPAQETELYESVAAMVRLMGIDDGAIPADYRAFRQYMETQLSEVIDRRPIHEALEARPPLPAPRRVPQVAWTAAQTSGRHVAGVVLGATLPDVTRERYGIRPSAAGRAEWALMSAAMGAFGYLPRRVRLVPAARR